MAKAVTNVIGFCIDKIMGLAPIARGHLAELLDPAKKTIEPYELEGILLYDKAIVLAIGGERHSLSDEIGNLVSVIENHKKFQESTIEDTFGKMQEALSSKKQLSDEIADFEQKQKTMINITLMVIVICSLCFCGCWIKFKKQTPEATEENKVDYVLTGTPEEQEKKAITMKKIVDTLGLMDAEILKMKEELASLKQR